MKTKILIVKTLRSLTSVLKVSTMIALGCSANSEIFISQDINATWHISLKIENFLSISLRNANLSRCNVLG